MLGIDIGSYSVKAVSVKKSGRKATIEQVACEQLPPEMRGGGAVDLNTLRQINARLIKQLGKSHKSVALSVPTASTILRTISLDADLSDELLEGEVQIELVNFVPFPLDQIYVDYTSLGKSEKNPGQQEVFVAVSRRDVVDKVAGSVNLKSITHKEVDIEAFAIGQLIEQIKGKNYRECYGVLDIGYRTTKMTVFKEGELLFSREQQIGGQQLTETISEVNAISIEEAESLKLTSISSVPENVLTNYLDSVSEQIVLAIEFFSSTNNQDIETIYVTGGGSLVPGLTQNLSENISAMQFEPLPIGQEIKLGKKLYGLSSEAAIAMSAVAAGLSMRK
ncbi:type IV pilus assembly protein PilM [Ostreibacterium oceani]|uniref:type IV pilus assembly protein PilM n=1 Tax=Ostreibacterium oceani TaxID=2654998 RepID=UPI002E267AC6